MEFKEVNLTEIQHKHPLVLVDLQLMYQNYQEDDDDFNDDDLITTQKFKCICNRCNLEIDWYHRYYFKCSMSCNYSIHKFCAEICITLRSPTHPSHTLHLKNGSSNWCCNECFTDHQDGICYYCLTCNYKMDLRCATFVDQKAVHHPGHLHPLAPVTSEPILSKCFACGMKHEGGFYHCNTCFNFSINSDCLALPIKLLLMYHHSHLLTLSYSFLEEVRECRICRKELYYDYWLYKCSKCMFYVHLHCATQSRHNITPELMEGCKSEVPKDCFPLPIESYELPHQYLENMAYQYSEENEDEDSKIHNHRLVLIQNETPTTLRKSISLHNPMKRIKLLCSACVRPITAMPFYRCSKEDKFCSNFVLHEQCSRLPTVLKFSPCHNEHELNLFPMQMPPGSSFFCKICDLPFNGFAYLCPECEYFIIDVNCALMPRNITHEAGPGHVLSLVQPDKRFEASCRACRHIFSQGDFYYKCNTCDFCLDMLCALHLPKTIRHKYDKHTLNLSYSPIENHRSQYFCEVCEEDLDPDMWFYHCSKCAQSVHSACSPLILKSEQGVNASKEDIIYKFLNIKFSEGLSFQKHKHPVSYVAGTKSDGDCMQCGIELQSKFIFKCFQCKFIMHIYCLKSAIKREVFTSEDKDFQTFIENLYDKLQTR